MTRSLRVLLVDENADAVAVTRALLERADADLDVRTVTSPATALERVAEEPFDVVVADYHPSGIDGVALAGRVRERAGSVPCLLYTAVARSAFEDVLGGSVAGHVHKRTGGDQYDELAALIREVA